MPDTIKAARLTAVRDTLSKLGERAELTDSELQAGIDIALDRKILDTPLFLAEIIHHWIATGQAIFMANPPPAAAYCK